MQAAVWVAAVEVEAAVTKSAVEAIKSESEATTKAVAVAVKRRQWMEWMRRR